MRTKEIQTKREPLYLFKNYDHHRSHDCDRDVNCHAKEWKFLIEVKKRANYLKHCTWILCCLSILLISCICTYFASSATKFYSSDVIYYTHFKASNLLNDVISFLQLQSVGVFWFSCPLYSRLVQRFPQLSSQKWSSVDQRVSFAWIYVT